MSNNLDKSLILKDLKNHYNFKKDSDFARFLGIKPQTLSSWYSRNTFDADLLYAKCEEVDANWLLSGEGEMLKVDQTKDVVNFNLRTDTNIEDQYIPLYNIEASCGLLELFQTSKHNVPIDFVYAPNIPKCDGSIYATGDSMYPLIKSGDIIGYKEVNDMVNGVFPGEIYLLGLDFDGDEMITIKYVKESSLGKEYYQLVSYNQHHQPKDVHISKIKAMALVKFAFRSLSMM